jgi:hypothetical protein
MLSVFFNLRTFAFPDLLPKATPFNAAHIVAQVIMPLHHFYCIATRENAR